MMDHGLDACLIFTTLNKEQYTKFEFLYVPKSTSLQSKFFPGKLYATDGLFYLGIDPSGAIKCVAFVII